jgi:hypothetical protein
VSPERLERRDQSPVRHGERGRVGQGARARELAEHLAVARARDVDLVEVRGDGIVVAGEQLEALDRVVDRVLLLPPGRHAASVPRVRVSA